MPLILQTVEKLEPERVSALPKVSGLQLGAYFLVSVFFLHITTLLLTLKIEDSLDGATLMTEAIKN